MLDKHINADVSCDSLLLRWNGGQKKNNEGHRCIYCDKNFSSVRVHLWSENNMNLCLKLSTLDILIYNVTVFFWLMCCLLISVPILIIILQCNLQIMNYTFLVNFAVLFIHRVALGLLSHCILQITIFSTSPTNWSNWNIWIT